LEEDELGSDDFQDCFEWDSFGYKWLPQWFFLFEEANTNWVTIHHVKVILQNDPLFGRVRMISRFISTDDRHQLSKWWDLHCLQSARCPEFSWASWFGRKWLHRVFRRGVSISSPRTNERTLLSSQSGTPRDQKIAGFSVSGYESIRHAGSLFADIGHQIRTWMTIRKWTNA
jgi:hypothetical protein